MGITLSAERGLSWLMYAYVGAGVLGTLLLLLIVIYVVLTVDHLVTHKKEVHKSLEQIDLNL